MYGIVGQMSRDESLSVRVTAEEKAELKRAADAEDRTPSALVRKIVVEWLRRHGRGRKK